MSAKPTETPNRRGRADLEDSLRRVKAYRETDPNFESAIAKFAESEARQGAGDPVEGTEDPGAFPAQRKVRRGPTTVTAKPARHR